MNQMEGRWLESEGAQYYSLVHENYLSRLYIVHSVWSGPALLACCSQLDRRPLEESSSRCALHVPGRRGRLPACPSGRLPGPGVQWMDHAGFTPPWYTATESYARILIPVAELSYGEYSRDNNCRSQFLQKRLGWSNEILLLASMDGYLIRNASEWSTRKNSRDFASSTGTEIILEINNYIMTKREQTGHDQLIELPRAYLWWIWVPWSPPGGLC